MKFSQSLPTLSGRPSPLSNRPGVFLVPFFMLGVATLGWIGDWILLTQAGVAICFVGTATMVMTELRRLWLGYGSLGYLCIVGGTLFWFLIDALQLAFSEIPFISRYSIYPFFDGSIPQDVAALALVCTMVFLLSATMAFHIFGLRTQFVAGQAMREDRLPGPRTDLLTLACAFLAYIPYVVESGGDLPLMISRLVAMRNAEAIADLALTEMGLSRHFMLLGLFGGTLATCRFILPVPGSWFARALAILVTAFWVFLGGTRFQMLFLAVPAFVLLWTVGPATWQWKMVRVRIMFATLIIGLAVWSQGALRDQGVRDLERIETLEDFVRGGSWGYEHFEALAIAIDLAQRRGEYFNEFMIPVIVKHFVPREWWPEKPDWESWAYYNDAVTGGTGAFNVTPSVPGQYYLNWGLWGVVFVGGLFGWLARLTDQWLRVASGTKFITSAAMGAFMLSFIFISFRILSPIYIAFVLAAFLIFRLSTRPVSKQYLLDRFPSRQMRSSVRPLGRVGVARTGQR